MGKRKVVVFYPQLLAEISECVVVELYPIVRDKDSGNSEVADDVLLDEASDVVLGNHG